MSVHVYPLWERHLHTLSTECRCKPTVERQDPKTGEWYGEGPLVIHNVITFKDVDGTYHEAYQ